jgi:protocatechuate 3,4-dioxygenase beta subunit
MTHAHDLGLQHDLGMLRSLDWRITHSVNRRAALRLIGITGLGVLAACGGNDKKPRASATSTTGSSSSTSSTSGATSTSTSSAGAPASTSGATCTEIPDETGGPFPGDGTNGPNALSQSGVVREDITRSFGSASGVASGVPLTINLTLQQRSRNCAAYAGAAVYLWHCDAEGRYSMYSQGAENENYLRGVQAADSSGRLTFKSIFPAAYSGRWPHIHFEIYPSAGAASSAGNRVKTSQLALPEDACKAVYATSGYPNSSSNLARTSLNSDMVFSDGYQSQLATVTGSPSSGYTASLTVVV